MCIRDSLEPVVDPGHGAGPERGRRGTDDHHAVADQVGLQLAVSAVDGTGGLVVVVEPALDHHEPGTYAERGRRTGRQ